MRLARPSTEILRLVLLHVPYRLESQGSGASHVLWPADHVDLVTQCLEGVVAQKHLLLPRLLLRDLWNVDLLNSPALSERFLLGLDGLPRYLLRCSLAVDHATIGKALLTLPRDPSNLTSHCGSLACRVSGDLTSAPLTTDEQRRPVGQDYRTVHLVVDLRQGGLLIHLDSPHHDARLLFPANDWWIEALSQSSGSIHELVGARAGSDVQVVDKRPRVRGLHILLGVGGDVSQVTNLKLLTQFERIQHPLLVPHMLRVRLTQVVQRISVALVNLDNRRYVLVSNGLLSDLSRDVTVRISSLSGAASGSIAMSSLGLSHLSFVTDINQGMTATIQTLISGNVPSMACLLLLSGVHVTSASSFDVDIETSQVYTTTNGADIFLVAFHGVVQLMDETVDILASFHYLVVRQLSLLGRIDEHVGRVVLEHPSVDSTIHREVDEIGRLHAQLSQADRLEAQLVVGKGTHHIWVYNASSWRIQDSLSLVESIDHLDGDFLVTIRAFREVPLLDVLVHRSRLVALPCLLGILWLRVDRLGVVYHKGEVLHPVAQHLLFRHDCLLSILVKRPGLAIVLVQELQN